MLKLSHSLVLAVALCGLMPAAANAQGRQYYDNSYSYNEINNYYYCQYHYQTAPATYSYHYVIYYPAHPRYVYYYNPHRRYYWGRYEIDENGKGKGYSMLEEKDRKEKLTDIPEKAFPKAGDMPPVPEGADAKEKMTPPPINNLPKDKK